jgi:hypothetical protein
MAVSFQDYTATADQVANGFSFSFPYLSDNSGNALLEVYVEGSLLSSSKYSITSSPQKIVISEGDVLVGDSVKIARASSTVDPLVDFQNGSVLTESELDRGYLHGFYLSQEAAEGSGGELLSKKGLTDYDAEGNKIINLGTPTANGDAANKAYVDQTIDNAELVGGSPATVSLGAYDVTSTDPVTSLSSIRARSLAERFGRFVNVMDFFRDDESPTDDSQPAFTRAVAHGGTILVPAGTYNFGSRVVVDNPTTCIGESISATVLVRDYDPGTLTVNDTKGIFYITGSGINLPDEGGLTGSGSISGLRDMSLKSKAGHSGGCLLAIEHSTTGSLGELSFINVSFSTFDPNGTTGTHDYSIYMDGTAKTSAPVGIRGVDFFGCHVFGARISTILAKGVLKWSFIGGGVYTAGGAATANVRMDGTSSVYTEHFTFQPTDCTSNISMDYAKLGYINTPSIPALYNTSNTNNITFIGYENPADLSDFENNWADSNVIHTRLGVILKSSQTHGSLIESDRLNGKLVNSNDYTPDNDIHIKNGSSYLENSFVKTSNKTCKAADLVNGNEYEILTVGSPATDFTLIGAANNNVGTVFTATGPDTSGGEGRVVGNTEVGHVGTPQSVTLQGHGGTLGNGESIDINISGGMLLHIQTGPGNAGLFFAEQATTTITTISDPSNKYSLLDPTLSGAADRICVTKSAASSIITLQNNFPGSLSLNILVLGRVLTVSDPA